MNLFYRPIVMRTLLILLVVLTRNAGALPDCRRYLLEDPRSLSARYRTESIVASSRAEDDSEFHSWLELGRTTILTNPSEPDRALAAAKYVHNTFSGTLGLKGFLRNPISLLKFHYMTGIPVLKSNVDYSDGTYPIGRLIKTGCGVCSHQAVVLTELSRELGFKEVYYVAGTIEVFQSKALVQRGRHAWVEVRLSSGQYLILEPTQGSAIDIPLENIKTNQRYVEKGNLEVRWTIDLYNSPSVEDLQEILIRETNDSHLP